MSDELKSHSFTDEQIAALQRWWDAILAGPIDRRPIVAPPDWEHRGRFLQVAIWHRRGWMRLFGCGFFWKDATIWPWAPFSERNRIGRSRWWLQIGRWRLGLLLP